MHPDRSKQQPNVLLDVHYHCMFAYTAVPSFERLVTFKYSYHSVHTCVQALQAHLGDMGVVFHDAVSGSVIGLMLRPAAFVPRQKLQVGSAHQMLPLTRATGGAQETLPNIVQLVREISLLGEGLVEDIQIRLNSVDGFAR